MGSSGFNLEQLALMHRCLRRSEALVSASFRIPAFPSKRYPYEVATLADLESAERASSAFAHLVVYGRERATGPEHLYRICLQDDVLLGRASDGGEGWLHALLVYVLTHELVHVVRFQREEEHFGADEPDRQTEEDRVHGITLELLAHGGEPEWKRLHDLYGNPVIPAHRVRAI
jgi:hypothetical protein